MDNTNLNSNNNNNNPYDSYPSYSNFYNKRPSSSDWTDIVLQPYPYTTHYTQGMSFIIRELLQEAQYEAKVIARYVSVLINALAHCFTRVSTFPPLSLSLILMTQKSCVKFNFSHDISRIRHPLSLERERENVLKVSFFIHPSILQHYNINKLIKKHHFCL